MARTPFAPRFFFSVACLLCHPERILVSSRAKPRAPGSFSTPADAPPTTDHAQCLTLELHSIFVSFRAKRRIPGPCLPRQLFIERGARIWGCEVESCYETLQRYSDERFRILG